MSARPLGQGSIHMWYRVPGQVSQGRRAIPPHGRSKLPPGISCCLFRALSGVLFRIMDVIRRLISSEGSFMIYTLNRRDATDEKVKKPRQVNFLSLQCFLLKENALEAFKSRLLTVRFLLNQTEDSIEPMWKFLGRWIFFFIYLFYWALIMVLVMSLSC